MREMVGCVTKEEKERIESLYLRKNALRELLLTVKRASEDEKDELYEKIVRDMGQTQMKFEAWWKEMREKYQWKSSDSGHWEINFETCEVYLAG